MEDRQAVHPRISAYTWLLLLAVASAAGERTEAARPASLSFDGSLTDFSFYTLCLPVRGILSGYPCVWVYVILYLSLSRFMNTL